MVTDDRPVDLVAQRFDAGVRFGDQLNQDAIAVKLPARVRFVAVASPAYLAAHPPVLAPSELAAHSCIRHRFGLGDELAWEFARDGVVDRIAVKGALTLDDQGSMIEAALAGAGVAYVFERVAAPYLACGALASVLEAWRPAFTDLYLYYPSRRQMSAGLRALIDALKEA